MIHRVLFYTDRHRTEKDFSTVGNYCMVTDLIDKELLSIIEEKGITHLVSAGDLYDRGYRMTSSTYRDIMADKRLTDAVNGNHYICIGNHFYLERDSNPEMYLIQPHDKIKPKDRLVTHGEPILKAPDKFRIGHVQISLFHYQREGHKNYHIKRDSDATFHIGVYHDPIVAPNSVRQHLGSGETTSDVLNNTYGNVDLAIMGHFHTPIGRVDIHTRNGIVPLLVPGSMCHTSVEIKARHKSVMLPIIEIDDEKNTHSISYVEVNLHLDKLKFYEKKKQLMDEVIPMDFGLDGLKGLDYGYEFTNISEFLKKRGRQSNHIQLFEAATEGPVKIQTAVKIMKGNV